MADKTTDKYLPLYPEDFDSSHIWTEVCDVLDISPSAAEVRIYFTAEDIITIGESNNGS